MNKNQFKRILQKFTDGAYEDEVLQALITEFGQVQDLTGIIDENLVKKIFEHLDKTLQNDIREKMKHGKGKNSTK